MWIKRNAPPRVPPRVKIRGTTEYAGMAELVDSVDLGAVTSGKVFWFCCPWKNWICGYDEIGKHTGFRFLRASLRVRVPLPAPRTKRQSIPVNCRFFLCFLHFLQAILSANYFLLWIFIVSSSPISFSSCRSSSQSWSNHRGLCVWLFHSWFLFDDWSALRYNAQKGICPPCWKAHPFFHPRGFPIPQRIAGSTTLE